MVTVAALNIFLATANIAMGICVVLWVIGSRASMEIEGSFFYRFISGYCLRR